ncbi:MAG: hypothetical protein PVSMB7_19400 [Chloroflexota bacterium]
MSGARYGAIGALMLASVSVAVGTNVQPALASCVGPFGPGSVQALRRVLSTAPVVFVGTVVATTNKSRTATVRVDDIWHGKHVSTMVVVRGSYVVGNGATSVDRVFRIGVRYLFVPESSTRSSPFQDNSCTATRPYTVALAKYRPAGAHRP